MRRFGSDGDVTGTWRIDDPQVHKTDNVVIAEDLAGTRAVLLLSDEEAWCACTRSRTGRFLGAVLDERARLYRHRQRHPLRPWQRPYRRGGTFTDMALLRSDGSSVH